MNLLWFKSYKTNIETLREHGRVVAGRTGSNVAEVMEHISSIESKIVTMQSAEGLSRLTAAESTMSSHLENLGPRYRRQNHSRCCGVATLAIAWDLLGKFNKEKLLTVEEEMFKISKALNENAIKQRGMVLEELFIASKEIFGSLSHNLTGHPHHITKEVPQSIECLKETLGNHFRDEKRSIMLCNYNMRLAGQGNWWGGHISLIAAYDMMSDSVLILDVWKYTDPFWIPIDKLFSSTILSIDSDSQKSRGFVRIVQTGKTSM